MFARANQWRLSGDRIGLVPTMGALHAGHLSLVSRSNSECQRTVVSVFVNPAQFGPNEDFSKYPRVLDEDLAALNKLKVDVVFVPSQNDLYPAGFSTYIDPPAASLPLEGVHRPGHFRGVATVVLKLFQIVPANLTYFGQKDYQQLAVIRRMVDDLNIPVRVVACPTVRESDGLAMSSRNRYLTPQQRPRALGLWAALSKAREMVEGGERNVPILEAAMIETLNQHVVDQIDYARIVDADMLSDLATIESSAVALIAVRIGQTRLIDNMLLEV